MKLWLPGRLCSWKSGIFVWLPYTERFCFSAFPFWPCHTARGTFSHQWLNWCPCVGSSESEPLHRPEAPLCLLLFFSLTVFLSIFNLFLAALGLTSACGLSLLQWVGAALQPWAEGSPRGGFSHRKAWAPGARSCGSRAQLPSGRGSSRRGSNPCPLA